MDASEAARRWIEGADRRVLGGLVRRVGVDTARERARLRRRGWPFLDPEATGEPPRRADVDRTAERVVEQAGAGQATLGTVAGLGGLVSIPAEIGAQVVASLRLAQRLALVYGFDPHDDRGRMAVSQALAAGLEITLPERGLVELRTRDLPAVLAGASPGQERMAATLARGAVVRATRAVAGRASRLVPVVASAAAAWGQHDALRDAGGRMAARLRRLAEAPAPRDVVDVQELPVADP